MDRHGLNDNVMLNLFQHLLYKIPKQVRNDKQIYALAMTEVVVEALETTRGSPFWGVFLIFKLKQMI